MNLRRLHDLEKMLHDKIYPVHPYLTMSSTKKSGERANEYIELSITIKIKSEEQINALSQFFKVLK